MSPGHCSGPGPSNQTPRWQESGDCISSDDSEVEACASWWPCRTDSHLFQFCGHSSVKYSETEAHGLPKCNLRDGSVEHKCGAHEDLDINLEDGWGYWEEKVSWCSVTSKFTIVISKADVRNNIFSIIPMNDFHLWYDPESFYTSSNPWNLFKGHLWRWNIVHFGRQSAYLPSWPRWCYLVLICFLQKMMFSLSFTFSCHANDYIVSIIASFFIFNLLLLYMCVCTGGGDATTCE